ncbi:MAG: polysaccharide deacetylase family protein [Firmicutes bacterium]|nr:polysaccharide deacetylase family protein [Bacillota bacterium]
MLATTMAAAVAIASPIHWGLGINEPNTLPTPPPGSVELLEKHNGLFVMPTEEKRAVFTFDLGYEAGYTGEVLDLLKQHDIKAIFFLCGHYLNEVDLVNRMIDEGHTIGNHTDKHKDPTKLSAEGVTKDIMTFQNDFTQKFPNAKAPTFYRPPMGHIDEKTLEIANKNGLRTMMWSTAIKDWDKTKPLDVEKSLATMKSRMHPGAVMLFHIANSGMPKLLEQLIPALKEDGFTFCLEGI